MAQVDVLELRMLQLKLLTDLDSFCRQHDLSYILWAGTLLGAVRHEGFIPWDDDIDVAMPRPDYERMLQMRELMNSETSHVLRVSEGLRDAYPYPYAKYMMRDTLHAENHAAAVPLGIHIDIFPLDGVPKRAMYRRLRRRGLLALQHMFSIKVAERGKRRRLILEIYVRAARSLLLPVPIGWLVRLAEFWSRRESFEDSLRAGCFVWGNREDFEISQVAQGGDLKFEGRAFPGPSDPDGVLGRVFGDYLRLPPAEQRVTHHDFRAYKLAVPDSSGPLG